LASCESMYPVLTFMRRLYSILLGLSSIRKEDAPFPVRSNPGVPWH
jgi:hypothetical protein